MQRNRLLERFGLGTTVHDSFDTPRTGKLDHHLCQGNVFDVQRDYAELINATARLMATGGVIYFSTNFRKFKFDPAALPGLKAKDISAQTIPKDFRNKRIHRCWRIVVG